MLLAQPGWQAWPAYHYLFEVVGAEPLSQVLDSQRQFLLFGALFVFHAVCFLTVPSLVISNYMPLRLCCKPLRKFFVL